jgi:hypothetical protein
LRRIRASCGGWISSGSAAVFASVHDFEAIVHVDGFNRFDRVFAEGAGFRGSDYFFCNAEWESLEEDSDDRVFLQVILRFPHKGLEFLDVQVDIAIFEGQLFNAFPSLGISLGVKESMFE